MRLCGSVPSVLMNNEMQHSPDEKYFPTVEWLRAKLLMMTGIGCLKHSGHDRGVITASQCSPGLKTNLAAAIAAAMHSGNEQ